MVPHEEGSWHFKSNIIYGNSLRPNTSYGTHGLKAQTPKPAGQFVPLISYHLCGCSYRREPFNEAHDYTFGSLENYHCWRFHGYGVMRAFEIVGLIFFSTRMHHEYFFQVINVLPCYPIMFENTENIPLIDRQWCAQCWFHGEFAIKTVVGFLQKNSLEKCVTSWSIYSCAILLVAG